MAPERTSPRTGSTRCALLCGIWLGVGLGPAATAEPSLGVALTSDYVFRGISQTMGRPALHTWAAMETPGGLWGSVWASNVDLVPHRDGDDGARLEIDLALGYAMGLGEDWSLDLTAVYYAFPGTDRGIDYDYLEWIGGLVYGDSLRLEAGYSDRVFGEAASGWFVEAGVAFAVLPAIGVDATAGAGHYDLDAALGDSYRYYRAGIGREFGPVHASLDWHGTSASASELFYPEAAGSRITLSLEWTLR